MSRASCLLRHLALAFNRQAACPGATDASEIKTALADVEKRLQSITKTGADGARLDSLRQRISRLKHLLP